MGISARGHDEFERRLHHSSSVSVEERYTLKY
jgi:hypothetical protein